MSQCKKEDINMSVKVAINGFGRIGRLAFRQMYEAEGYDVVAINDLTDPGMLANLLKYDSAQKSFCGYLGENKHTVAAGEDCIIVDGNRIPIYKEADAKNLPWGELGIDVVTARILRNRDIETLEDSSSGVFFIPESPKSLAEQAFCDKKLILFEKCTS